MVERNLIDNPRPVWPTTAVTVIGVEGLLWENIHYISGDLGWLDHRQFPLSCMNTLKLGRLLRDEYLIHSPKSKNPVVLIGVNLFWKRSKEELRKTYPTPLQLTTDESPRNGCLKRANCPQKRSERWQKCGPVAVFPLEVRRTVTGKWYGEVCQSQAFGEVNRGPRSDFVSMFFAKITPPLT